MYNNDAKLLTRMAPLLKRVLIIDPHPAAARLLSDLLRNISPGQVWTAATAERGLAMARSVDPQIIFVEHAQGILDGATFTRSLRRTGYSCRQAPVIMVTSEATAASIMAARDAGVHEFLRKPYTLGDLIKRLEAVTLRPRDWIEAVHYVGPDRRRFNSGDYQGKRKRKVDAVASDHDRMVQALKIIRAAAKAVDSDPAQVRRALAQQAADLQKAGIAMADLRLCEAAAELARVTADDRQVLTASDIESQVMTLMSHMPPEEARSAA